MTRDDYMLTRGEHMRRARKRAELTIVQLSALSGVPTQTIGNLEHGRREGRIVTIELLADVLGISIDEYIGHKIRVKRHG